MIVGPSGRKAPRWNMTMCSCLTTGASTRFWVLEILSVLNETGTYQRLYAPPGECESSPFFQCRRERWEPPARRLVNMNSNSNIWRRVVELLTRISNTWGNVVGARNGTKRHNEPAARDCEFQGRKVCHRLERRIIISQVVRTCLNHFRFMIIFITMIFVSPSRVHADNS